MPDQYTSKLELSLMVTLPLAAWKLCDLVVWVLKHVKIVYEN